MEAGLQMIDNPFHSVLSTVYLPHQSISSSVFVPRQHDRNSLANGCVLWNRHRQIWSDVKLWAVVILVENGDWHLSKLQSNETWDVTIFFDRTLTFVALKMIRWQRITHLPSTNVHQERNRIKKRIQQVKSDVYIVHQNHTVIFISHHYHSSCWIQSCL